MSVPSTIPGPPGVRADLIAELVAVRDAVVGPDGMDPALSRPLSLEDDAVEMCGAVYALPDQFRERGRSGTPLMWPWPWSLFRSGMPRRDELLLAAAMLLDGPADAAQVVQRVSELLGPDDLLRAMDAIGTSRERIGANVNPLLALEAMALDLRLPR